MNPPDPDAELKAAIERMAAPQVPGKAASRSQEVMLLYTQKQEWARHFNGLIWSITAILLPVSLGGLVFTFRDDAGILNQPTLIFAAAGSSMLLIFWNLICDRHRTLWERQLAVGRLIEGAWGLPRAPMGHDRVGRGSVKRIRNVICWLGVGTWILRVVVELFLSG